MEKKQVSKKMELIATVSGSEKYMKIRNQEGKPWYVRIAGQEGHKLMLVLTNKTKTSTVAFTTDGYKVTAVTKVNPEQQEILNFVEKNVKNFYNSNIKSEKVQIKISEEKIKKAVAKELKK